MRYEGTVYRPPSEARSLIVQLTIGCARNTCRFCYMYKDKSFRVRPIEEVIDDLKMAKSLYQYPIKRIFLADGDALIVKTGDLLKVLAEIKEIFPMIERVSSYGAPKDILDKSLEELKELRQAGLDMVYMGVESGDDGVLEMMKKGVTSKEIVEAGIRLKQAGITTSVTLISSLGGRNLLKQHAVESARVISAIKPDYLGFLTLMVEEGAPLYNDIKTGEFPILNPNEVLMEMKLFLENVNSEGTVFRSNHASNYLNLSGILNKDISNMLSVIEQCEELKAYKPDEWRQL